MVLLEWATSLTDSFLKIFTIIRIFIPLFVRILEGNYYLGHYWYEYIVTVGLMYFYYIIFGYNIRFNYAGVTDFRRKLFLMKILQSMISVEKDKDFTFSTYFPTLNICWMKNLNNWMQLRATCLDIGLKYTYRIFSLLLCILRTISWFIHIYCFMFLWNFEIQSTSNNVYYRLIWYSYYLCNFIQNAETWSRNKWVLWYFQRHPD